MVTVQEWTYLYVTDERKKSRVTQMEEFLNSCNYSTIYCTAPGLFSKDLKLSFHKNSSSLLEKAVTSTQKARKNVPKSRKKSLLEVSKNKFKYCHIFIYLLVHFLPQNCSNISHILTFWLDSSFPLSLPRMHLDSN